MSTKPDENTLTGQCLCGSIKYEVTDLQPKMAHCHCSMCRKFHGAAFGTYGVAKANNFKWLQGEEFLKTFTAPNGTKRQFCSECGSSLTFAPINDPGTHVEFTLSTLESEVTVKPDCHIYCSYKADWYEITDDLPQYPEGRES